MKRLTARLPITAILLLAAVLRIIGAGGYPVWTDEGWSIWAASSPATVIARVAADRHPPLYFAALSLWRIPAGDSHLALRFLSIAGGLILVAAVYRIGADWFGRRAALFAALLIAGLPAAVYYGQEVRHYGWLATFSALSWLIFLRYLRHPRRSLWIGYVLSAAALLYTLYFGVLTIAMQAAVGFIAPIFVGAHRRVRPNKGRHIGLPLRRWAALIAAWIAAVILYGPWLYVIVTQQAGLLSTGIQGAPGTLTAANVLPILQIGFGLHLLLTIPAFLLGAWAILRRPSIQRVAALLGGGGLLVIMVILNVRFDFLAARTLVFLTPLLMLVCGVGFSHIDRRIGVPLVGVWLILTLAVAQVIQPRLGSDAAARALASAYQPGDAVILETGWDDNAFAYEVAQALPKGASITRTLPWTNERTGGQPIIPQIEPILQTHQRVWVVRWLQAPQVLPFLEGGGDGFHLQQTLDVSAGDYGARFNAPTIEVKLFVAGAG